MKNVKDKYTILVITYNHLCNYMFILAIYLTNVLYITYIYFNIKMYLTCY